MQDAISRIKIREVCEARDASTAQAIYEAAGAINQAEYAIRGRIRDIRASLDRIEERIDQRFLLSEWGELGSKPVELEMALATRRIAYGTLAALLTDEEKKTLLGAK